MPSHIKHMDKMLKISVFQIPHRLNFLLVQALLRKILF